MKATINREECIGCGFCASICTEVFRIAADGKAEAYAAIETQNESDAQDAASACPVNVIAIDD